MVILKSQLIGFGLLGGRGLGHRYKQGQKGQHWAWSSTLFTRKAAPGLRGCVGAAHSRSLESYRVRARAVLGISSSVILTL